jgi:hypothetical protein
MDQLILPSGLQALHVVICVKVFKIIGVEEYRGFSGLVKEECN